MEQEKRPIVRRPNVLKKLNTESLQVIERGLLGDLPDRLKPSRVPVRGRLTDLVVAKPSAGFLSCLPVIPDSPISERFPSSDDEDSGSPLKKSFSFRDKFSRISFLGKKEKEKPKWKTIAEDDKSTLPCPDKETNVSQDGDDRAHKAEHKRFWLFRNKDLAEKKNQPPLYKRSKSFEFLPRAVEEESEHVTTSSKKLVKNSLSFLFGSTDSIVDDVWASNESLDYPSNVYYNDDDAIYLKSVKELSPNSSKNSANNSSVSTVTSGSSVPSIFERKSVQNLLEQFDKAVELFSENYMSDSEPYTKTGKKETLSKRKSSSFSTLPSPRVLQAAKVSEVSEAFKKELSKQLSEKRIKSLGGESPRSARRGSVTDWFVLEDQAAVGAVRVAEDKYRRAQQKPMNRVRRMSSTKYWITPEECAVYSREQRPPLVIPRITQYRPPHRNNVQLTYPEKSPQESVKSSVRQYDRLQDWSPGSERGYKGGSDSPPFGMLHKRLGGSTENLLIASPRRPNHLQLPTSSSGDSLDVEVRERPSGQVRSRKSRSMLAPKQRVRSPVPAPRMLVHQPPGVTVLLEGPVKRTKFSENGKKSRKNWVDCYMTLTPTSLVFYKDHKTYNATKQPRLPGTPPSPTAPRAELVLPLQNAHIMQCIQMHTRRYTRSLVLTVGYDQYLLQDETEEGAKRWLMCIQNVYYKLGPPKLDEFVQPAQYQSSNTDLESLGRTPPVSRHSNRSNQKAGGSSNEDLSDSTEVSIPKSHVKRRLRNFFAKRPTMDSLVKKGIYQEEPVFGRKLEEVCPSASPRVPDFVVECVREIESSKENMTTDGLYRASGNLSQVQKIRLEVDQNKLSVIKNSADIHVLTGSLKLFFRELKEPLIPCCLFDRVLAACSIKPREAKIKEFRDIVHSLPQCNRETLKFLLEHLLRVTQFSEQNRMHTANLAIVFGPTLLWAPAEQAHNIAIDCIQQNHVVEILLNDFKEIFAEENGKAKKKT